MICRTKVKERSEPVTKISDQLSECLNFLEQSKKDYRHYYNEVNDKDKENQDYLHELELEQLSYHELAKHAKKMRKSRKERREAKDAVEALSPLIEFLESDLGIKSLNQLKQVLGKVRQKEKNQQNRIYIKRKGAS